MEARCDKDTVGPTRLKKSGVFAAVQGVGWLQRELVVMRCLDVACWRAGEPLRRRVLREKGCVADEPCIALDNPSHGRFQVRTTRAVVERQRERVLHVATRIPQPAATCTVPAMQTVGGTRSANADIGGMQVTIDAGSVDCNESCSSWTCFSR